MNQLVKFFIMSINEQFIYYDPDLRGTTQLLINLNESIREIIYSELLKWTIILI